MHDGAAARSLRTNRLTTGLGAVGRVLRAATSPRRYVALLGKVSEQALARWFASTAFYLQGQMDIHPRSHWFKPDFAAACGGFFPPANATEGAVRREVSELEPWDCTRRDMLALLLRSVIVRGVSGDFVELGVYRGGTARLIHRYAPERVLHLFDTFSGFDPHDVAHEARATGLQTSASTFTDTSAEGVLRYVGGPAGRVRAYPGRFPDSWSSELDRTSFAFVHLDADLYAPTLAGLELFYPRTSPGGVIVVHDYNAWPGARSAVDGFFSDKPEVPIPMPDKSGSVVVVKR
jgi:O-methyltransferase